MRTETTTLTVRNIYSHYEFPVKFHGDHTQEQARKWLADHSGHLTFVEMTTTESA